MERKNNAAFFIFLKTVFGAALLVPLFFQPFVTSGAKPSETSQKEQNKQTFIQICQPMLKINNAICCMFYAVYIFHRVIRGLSIIFSPGRGGGGGSGLRQDAVSSQEDHG